MQTIINLSFWLSGQGFQKIRSAAIIYFDLIKSYLDYPFTQIDPALCDEAYLPLHAWMYDIPRLEGESIQFYRDRIRFAHANQLQAGGALGLIEIMNRLGVNFISVTERIPGLDWDIVIVQVPDGEYTASQALFDNLVERFGRTCRRYSFEEIDEIGLESYGAEFGMTYTTEEASFIW